MNFSSWFGSKETKTTAASQAVFRGAPATARLKTYSAETGFVYQYVYRGYRLSDEISDTTYYFSVTRDRKSYFFVTVRLSVDAKERWQQMSGRALLDVEGYAVAKMSLFAALDERSDIERLGEPILLDALAINGHLQKLNRL